MSTLDMIWASVKFSGRFATSPRFSMFRGGTIDCTTSTILRQKLRHGCVAFASLSTARYRSAIRLGKRQWRCGRKTKSTPTRVDNNHIFAKFTKNTHRLMTIAIGLHHHSRGCRRTRHRQDKPRRTGSTVVYRREILFDVEKNTW